MFHWRHQIYEQYLCSYAAEKPCVITLNRQLAVSKSLSIKLGRLVYTFVSFIITCVLLCDVDTVSEKLLNFHENDRRGRKDMELLSKLFIGGLMIYLNKYFLLVSLLRSPNASQIFHASRSQWEDAN